MSDDPSGEQTTPTDPASSSGPDWYYENNGTRVGPVAIQALRELLKQGDISNDTLAWNSMFGQQWKPIRDTEIVQSDMPPPLPASRVDNTFAWFLALIPIIGALVEKVAGDVWGSNLASTQTFLIYVGVNSVLALIDAKRIENSGRNKKNVKLGIWFWLIPAYLFQRARALQQSFAYVWVWVISFAAGIFLSNPNIFSGNTYWGAGLPPCDSSFAVNQVKSIFKDIPLVRLAGAQAIDVRDQTEVSVAGSLRTCRATVLASNTISYTVSYTIELRGEQIFTNVNIVK